MLKCTARHNTSSGCGCGLEGGQVLESTGVLVLGTVVGRPYRLPHKQAHRLRVIMTTDRSQLLMGMPRSKRVPMV
jgi:hypothetical protein